MNYFNRTGSHSIVTNSFNVLLSLETVLQLQMTFLRNGLLFSDGLFTLTGTGKGNGTDTIAFFHKHTTLAIVPILTSDDLLCKNKISSNKILSPVRTEPVKSDSKSNTLLSKQSWHVLHVLRGYYKLHTKLYSNIVFYLPAWYVKKLLAKVDSTKGNNFLTHPKGK